MMKQTIGISFYDRQIEALFDDNFLLVELWVQERAKDAVKQTLQVHIDQDTRYDSEVSVLERND